MSNFNKIVMGKSRPTDDGSIGSLRHRLREVESDVSLGKSDVAMSAWGVENHSDVLANTQYSDLHATIVGLIGSKTADQLNFGIEDYQVRAASWATLLAADPGLYGEQATQLTLPKGAHLAITQTPGGNFNAEGLGLESYNSDDRDVQMSTLLFNLLGSANDSFTNMFFPTVLVDPSEIGVKIEINIDTIHNDIIRNISGNLTDWGRQNLVRAYVDGEILNNKLTHIVPRFRDSGNGKNSDSFADATLVPPTEVPLGGGRKAITSSLLPGKEIELINISQANEELANGPANYTDTISPAVTLEYLDIQVGTDVWRCETRFLLGSEFTPAFNGESTKLNLNFDSDSVTIRAGAMTVQNAEATQAELKDVNVRLQVSANANITTDGGRIRLTADQVTFVAASDKDLQPLAVDKVEAIEALFADAKVVGYKVAAFHDNLNLRFIGLLLDSKRYFMYAPVAYQPPMSKVAPLSTAAQTYESDLTTLTAAHHIAGADKAIERMEEIRRQLKNYVAVTTRDGISPALNCVGAYYVKPTYRERQIDLADIVDGMRSAERAEDVRMALFEYIHSMALELKIASELDPALRVTTGNQNAKPVLCIGTDEEIYSYLTSKAGDVIEREEYDIRIECTPNKRVKGLIYISFSNLGKNANSADKVTPFTLGNHLYSPVVVTNVPKSIGGQKSNYLTTAPRREFLWNSPILGVIEVSGISKIAGKLNTSFAK